jgi:His/Glu/Gln/Arg/opine family amino acid ABC transporter permease subunit
MIELSLNFRLRHGLMPNWFTPQILTLLSQGLWLTISLALITSLLAMGLGIGVGLLRLWGKGGAALAATLFVETFRNIPALVLIIFWAFAFPNAFPAQSRQLIFFDNDVIHNLGYLSGLSIPWYGVAAILALTLNTAAYIAELFRAGVRTIAQEHVDAAQSMGASWRTIFRVILIPGGLRAAYPAITSRLIHNLKNTALVSLIAIPEFFGSINTAITRSFMAVEFLTLAALVYLALSAAMLLGLRFLERWLYPRPAKKMVTS